MATKTSFKNNFKTNSWQLDKLPSRFFLFEE